MEQQTDQREKNPLLWTRLEHVDAFTFKSYLDVKYPSNTYAVTMDSILNIPLVQIESRVKLSVFIFTYKNQIFPLLYLWLGKL